VSEQRTDWWCTTYVVPNARCDTETTWRHAKNKKRKRKKDTPRMYGRIGPIWKKRRERDSSPPRALSPHGRPPRTPLDWCVVLDKARFKRPISHSGGCFDESVSGISTNRHNQMDQPTLTSTFWPSHICRATQTSWSRSHRCPPFTISPAVRLRPPRSRRSRCSNRCVNCR